MYTSEQGIALTSEQLSRRLGIRTKLSSKLGQSKAQVIKITLKQLAERIFWDEVTESFTGIAASPEESARKREEIQLWEHGTAADF